MPPKKRPSVNLKRKKAPVQRKADEVASSFHDQIAAAAAEEPPIEQDVVNGGSNIAPTRDVDPSLDANQIGGSILQHLRNQDDHINRLSSTVDELRKTMGEMSESLKKLVNENRQHPSSAADASSGNQFDLVASVLREMRSKDDKAEKLQLQNDVLTLKIRHLEERQSGNCGGRLPTEPQNPRSEDNDRPDPMSVKVPLRGCDDRVPENLVASSAAPIQQRFPEVQVTVPAPRGRQTKRRSTSNLGSRPATADPGKPSDVEPPAKKPRRYSAKDPVSKSSATDQKAQVKRGRSLPRSSATTVISATEAPVITDPDENKVSHAAPPLQQIHTSSPTSNLSTASTAKEDPREPVTAPETQRRRRSERSSTRMSRRPSLEQAPQTSQQVIPASDGTEGEEQSADDRPAKESKQDEQERLRKEQIAARDRLVELTMRREEAMNTT
ncbi:hypothetical protein FQN54_009245 [Arachnomyces sp. PD_36]|nr:hypothetical protein FQN54_009245 [Arachnomyces sp. PD_36]